MTALGVCPSLAPFPFIYWGDLLTNRQVEVLGTLRAGRRIDLDVFLAKSMRWTRARMHAWANLTVFGSSWDRI